MSLVLTAVLRQHAEGVAHHGRAGDLAEGADMGEARRAVAGLEDHLGLWRALQALDQLSRLLERPGFGDLGGLA